MNSESKVDPERDNRYIIEYNNAADCPDVFFWTNQGFVNRLAAEHGQPDL